MGSLQDLPTWNEDTGLLNVVVESPRRSRNKYKFIPEQNLWKLSKLLPVGSSFPYDFGFIPSTQGEDGDALDVLLMTEEPTFPGCVVSARLIGVLEAEQTENDKTIRNDRLIAVVETPYNPPLYQNLADVGEFRLAEIEHFFIAYNAMEGRQFRPIGRHGPERAHQILQQGGARPATGSNGTTPPKGRARK